MAEGGIIFVKRLAPFVLLVFTLGIVFLVYRPGLNGPFVFDDGPNIVHNQHLRLSNLSPEDLREAAFSSTSGLFFRPLSMLSFSLNFYHAGSIMPFPFKVTNLVIHLLNGIAIFVLTRLIAGLYRERREPLLPASYPDLLALAVAAAWLLHPLNLTGVLYVVQRMTSLAALFTFIGLTCYVWGRTRLCIGRQGGIAAIFSSLLIFTPLAVLSKESGILLPFFMLAAELTLFRFETAHLAARRTLIIFFAVSTVLPTLLFLSYVTVHPEWLMAGYEKRDFSIFERLMTEARVLWFYLRSIVLPSTALMGLYHDDIVTSRSLLDPASTLFSIIGILGLFSCIWLLRRRLPLVAFGLFFFFIGHSLESSFFALELVHEHRNYLPIYGILLACFHILLDPLHAVSMRLSRRVFAVLLISLFSVATFSRANDWSNPFDLWHAEIMHHPDSARTNVEIGDLYANFKTATPASMENNYQLSRYYYTQAAIVQKSNINGLFGLIQLNSLHRKPVEKIWIQELAYRLEHEAIPTNTHEQLIALVTCQMQAICLLAGDEVETLLNAPLHNSHIAGSNKALLYSALSYYQVNIAHDYPAAVITMHRSIELAPQQLYYHMTLIKFLTAIKHFDEARKQVALLKDVDGFGVFAKEIALQEKLLQSN